MMYRVRASMTTIYAGIGSRETPELILDYMEYRAKVYGSRGYRLRSGGAKGADTAYEKGHRKYSKDIEIYKPSDDIPEAAYEMAAKYHPAWDKCNGFAQSAHARNCMIVLGKNLDTPVDFIDCWTKDGKIIGGTGQALRMAIDLHIPIFNLAYGHTSLY